MLMQSPCVCTSTLQTETLDNSTPLDFPQIENMRIDQLLLTISSVSPPGDATMIEARYPKLTQLRNVGKGWHGHH
jgi:hypothetical protein